MIKLFMLFGACVYANSRPFKILCNSFHLSPSPLSPTSLSSPSSSPSSLLSPLLSSHLSRAFPPSSPSPSPPLPPLPLLLTCYGHHDLTTCKEGVLWQLSDDVYLLPILRIRINRSLFTQLVTIYLNQKTTIRKSENQKIRKSENQKIKKKIKKSKKLKQKVEKEKRLGEGGQSCGSNKRGLCQHRAAEGV